MEETTMTVAVSINGIITPPEKASISVFDHGFLFGDSIYEVARTVGGKLFMFDAHMERLRRSAAYLNMDIPVDDDTLYAWTTAAIQAAGNEESYMRLIVTRGAGKVHIDPTTASDPAVIILAKEYQRYPEELYEKGIRTAIVTVRRNHPQALNPAAKTGNYLNSMLALVESQQYDAVDALMLSHSGYLTEATTSNLFFIAKGVLCTPSLSCGILPGITRRVINEAAGRVDLQVKEGKYRKRSLFEADEAFVSSTLKDVMPISEVYDAEEERTVRIGHGRPGPLTRKLMKVWPEIVQEFMLRYR